MRFFDGNVVDALFGREVDVIAHVCNNKHVMGSGVALEIKQRIPTAYNIYANSPCELGNLSSGGGVFNMVAQDGYGTMNKRYLNYGALSSCLDKVNYHTADGTVIGMPYNMGAYRAGGDFEIVKELCGFYLERNGKHVVWYKL